MTRAHTIIEPRHTPMRRETARLLRELRAATPAERDDLVDWAFVALPQSVHAERIKIRQLLDHGNLEAADAMIAGALLRRPTDGQLILLRAEVLARRERWHEVSAELRLFLARRPRHGRALCLAARAADARGATAEAVELLERARAARPFDHDVAAALVRQHLRHDDVRCAEEVIETMPGPPAPLRAAVLAARGRTLDAIALLDAHLTDTFGDDQSEALVMLVDLLEQIGDDDRLVALADRLEADGRTVAAGRTALALLGRGLFHRAAVLAARLAAAPIASRDALHTLVVAATLADRPGLARRALARLQASSRGVDRPRLARAWRKGFRARLIADQTSPTRAGADPSPSMLQPLLREAVAVLDAALAEGDADRVEPGDERLASMRLTCRGLLGESEARPVAASPLRRAA